MQNTSPPQGDILSFLREGAGTPSTEPFVISDGSTINIDKYSLTFSPWQGPSIQSTWNNKQVIDFEGRPLFAELAVLRLFQKQGWGGAWVTSRKCYVELPERKVPVSLPPEQQILIDTLRSRVGRSAGCWDVIVWKDGTTLFVELKRGGKDRIQKSQVRWLEEGLRQGLKPGNFLLVEWGLR